MEGTGLLGTAGDWQLQADLRGRMQFPQEIAATNQRPDIVIWSPSSRPAILVELTVPWEERIEEAYERKRNKYQDLVADCQQRGWRVWCLPVEVGCRGFVGQSLWRAGHWCHWYGETATHRTTEQGSGDGIDVAVEEERGAVESATLVTSCVWTLYKRHTKGVITSRRAES